ncbi:MAG: hypothetical protein R3E10_10365 [Gemmatimonadota bacterium]
MSSRSKHPRSSTHHAHASLALLSIAGLALGLGGCTDPVGPRLGEQAGVSRGEMVNENNDARVHIEIDDFEQWMPYVEKGLHD